MWPQTTLTSGKSNHFKGLKSHCALFSEYILVIPTKLGRDIGRCKGHIFCEFDPKWPWHRYWGPTWSVGPICVWLLWSRRRRIQNVYGNRCPRPSAFNFAENPMIFRAHIIRVVPECSKKIGPSCARFCEMASILNKKNHTFALFSFTVLGIRAKLGRVIGSGNWHLIRNLTSNDLDLGKWRPF